jgi:hypothetical protein
MLLVNGGTIDMDEPDWYCRACLEEECMWDEYCSDCWLEERPAHKNDGHCPLKSEPEVDQLRRESKQLVKEVFNLNQELLNRKRHARRLGQRLGFVTSERDRLINKLANINENWEKWQHQYLKLQEENRKLQEEADCFSETFIVYSGKAEEQIKELEDEVSQLKLRLVCVDTVAMAQRLEDAIQGRLEIARESIRLREALKLIAAVPAFPSKDIADKALGSQGPDWEPKAVKEYREKKDGQG